MVLVLCELCGLLCLCVIVWCWFDWLCVYVEGCVLLLVVSEYDGCEGVLYDGVVC